MTQFLEFSTEAEAEAFQAKMDAQEGYPNAATKTDRYCLVTKHPSQKRWVAPVDRPQEGKLTEQEKTAQKSLNDVKGFFQ